MNMKQVLFVPITMAFLMLVIWGCDNDKDEASVEVSAEIMQFLSTHFPNNHIVKTEVEIENGVNTYEVKLQGDFSLKFNSEFEIIDIEGASKLPDSVIPEILRDYVTANYPENHIIGWELEGANQQIELNNDIELEFTMDGEFIRVDR